ncbi:uncharacterized protein (DUF58 family) [Micromonospora pisi]|uniref:Uncharacterized protein (DUF58 family) n=1 Tax=Micromonospora pisi TaxID=589240 RepID=A0A495JCP2_9ACTN|nr:DUF58 domain-containing protein [Micromonospora pisi]RKR86695.1 uncharacterized protein (DUF58 family) [Micromonospora pisi]
MKITSRGIGLLVGAGLLLLLGFRFGYPELTLLGTAAAIAVGCAVGVAAWRPRLQVERRADPDRVGRGEPATMALTVRNGDRFRSANMIAEDQCGSRPVPVPLLRLRPGRDTTVSYPVPTHRRGVVPVGPLRVTGRDALGLVVMARAHGEVAQVWVHPRIHPLSAVPAGVARSMDGRIDRVPHGSITFDSLREYVVGDELRRVHWRTSARIGELMVREHLDTSLPRLVVVLDDRAAAHPVLVDGVAETFESACEAAASVVAAARREELPVALVLVADPGGGGDFLDRLAAAELRTAPALARDVSDGDPFGSAATAGPAGDPLGAVLNRLRQQRLGDTLVFLTGPGARDDLGQLGALRPAYPSVLAAVFGDLVPAPGETAGVRVLDVADGAEFASEWDGVRRW